MKCSLCGNPFPIDATELRKIIMNRLEEVGYFKRISPELFGCEFLHDPKFYQDRLQGELIIILQGINYHSSGGKANATE